MIRKTIKNYISLLALKIKKKNILKKSIIQNNNIMIEKNFFLKLKKKNKVKKKISQINNNTRCIKKNLWMNRWEIIKFLNNNNMVNYKKWRK